jgi:hypothetical protein
LTRHADTYGPLLHEIATGSMDEDMHAIGYLFRRLSVQTAICSDRGHGFADRDWR